MLSGSTEVINSGRNLEKITAVITESVHEMAENARKISTAVQKVNDISVENKHSIDTLAAEVGKFKVD
jgi:methyl-accepting chemotaxis protein